MQNIGGLCEGVDVGDGGRRYKWVRYIGRLCCRYHLCTLLQVVLHSIRWDDIIRMEIGHCLCTESSLPP